MKEALKNGNLAVEVQTDQCTKQPAASAATNVKYHLSQAAIDRFTVAIVLKTMQVRIQEGLKEETSKDLVLEIGRCMKQYVINAAANAACLSSPEAENQFIAVNVLKARATEAAGASNNITNNLQL